MRTLLAVFAHPDDESFGPGGTLARYASESVSVHLICATGGEAGETGLAESGGGTDLACRREGELRCAASALGLADVHLLGFRDSGMPGSAANDHPEALAQAKTEDVAERVASVMRRLRPQVVITFDPAGGYGHPDHIAIHRATVAAWDFTCSQTPPQRRPQKLYYVAFPHALLRWAIRVMPLIGIDPERVGKNGDINLRRMLAHESPVSARIDVRRFADVKRRAVACHSSQISRSGTFSGRLAGGIARRWLTTETFHRAVPAARRFEPVEKDLFDGVT